MFDTVIIGGGPAGLSAALVLGRARRNVLLIDADRPRNKVTRYSHGFLSRDGISPSDFKAAAHHDISKYPSVTIKRTEVVHARKNDKHFAIVTMNKDVFEAKKIIIATGVKEILPNIKSLGRFYGKSIFNCVYCDGWEVRDKRLAILSSHLGTLQLVKLVYNWSKNLIVCTNGHHPIDQKTKQTLQLKGIEVIETIITELTGAGDQVEAVRFADGREEPIEAGFISPEWCHSGYIANGLGCKKMPQGGIMTDGMGRTNIQGVYAAGDSSNISPSQIAIAVGDGSRTAIGVNMDLTNEEFK
ncbi:NAD(P)/FAD-dependent oxidoreductase [Cytobacillus horneckiae]|uniref:NAD(P)/FAD-dependent oxidoreductase n=1 Tax=Cytobacillus horneckiae TaxID=549687 RepID=UPI0034CE803A